VKPRKVLDSFALLAYLQGEKGQAAVRETLSSGRRVLMNEINVGEVYYILARARGRERADYFLRTILPQLSIDIVTNDLEAVIEAARIKAAYAMAFADCFAVMTAQRDNAALLTGDPEFKAVASIVTVEWIS
jgi:predicted nucleic acid-binding protein